MFIAINYISCNNDFKDRFEFLFSTRAKAIDTMPGFIDMQVLKPTDDAGEYLIVSRWDKEENFQKWTNSPQFLEGHKRGFKDLSDVKKEGHESPIKSSFKTYKVIAQ